MSIRGIFKFAIGSVVALLAAGAVLSVLRGNRDESSRRQGHPGAAVPQEVKRPEPAPVFGEPVAPSAEEAQDFVRVLTAFGDALHEGRPGVVAGLMDPERMLDELPRLAGAGGSLPSSPQFRAGFLKGFRERAGAGVVNPAFNWDSTTIRRVSWSADRGEVVVVASHRQSLQLLGRDVPVTLKIRWWFVRRPDGWKVYDYEDRDAGFRMTAVVACMLSPEYLPRLPELNKAIAALHDAQAALVRLDLAALDAALARCRTAKVPPAIAAVIHLLDSTAHRLRGDVDAALAALERAERLNPEMPLRHLIRAECHNQLGEYEQALAAADAYIARLGPDAQIDNERGKALEELERWDEAAAAYGRALADAPDLKEAFEGLLRVLPDADKGELADLLEKTPDPSKTFDRWAGFAREAGDLVALQALERGLRRVLPNDPRLSKPTRPKD